MSDGSVSSMTPKLPVASALKWRSSVLRNFTLSRACTYALDSSPNWTRKSSRAGSRASSSASRIGRTRALLSCSYIVDSVVLRERQNSTSCSGRVPLSLSDTAPVTCAIVRVQLSTASTRMDLTDSSCAAAAGSESSRSGIVRRTSPVSCSSEGRWAEEAVQGGRVRPPPGHPDPPGGSCATRPSRSGAART